MKEQYCSDVFNEKKAVLFIMKLNTKMSCTFYLGQEKDVVNTQKKEKRKLITS